MIFTIFEKQQSEQFFYHLVFTRKLRFGWPIFIFPKYYDWIFLIHLSLYYLGNNLGIKKKATEDNNLIQETPDFKSVDIVF